MEIQEDKEAMAQKEFCAPDTPAGKSFILRVTKAWRSSIRIVLGDAALASVLSAVWLRKAGLFFIGLVKTVTKYFCKIFLQDEPVAERGDTVTATAVKDSVHLIAHAWADPGPVKPDKPRKCLIATCGTTLPVDPSLHLRYRVDPETGKMKAYQKEDKHTDIVKTYFTGAGAIDRFNHGRFRLERNFEVKNWAQRMIVSMLGFVGTNAYMAARLEGRASDLGDFLEELAEELIMNTYEGLRYPQAKLDLQKHSFDADAFVDGQVPQGLVPHASFGIPTGTQMMHVIRPLSSLWAYSAHANPRGTCTICGKNNASMFCVNCSPQQGGKPVFLCGAAGGADCISWHCQLCGE
jgi:hypothetical protein